MKKSAKRALLGGAGLLGVPIATFLALVALPLPAPLSPERTSNPVVIANVGVVDLDAGAILPEQTVVIEKGRIQALDLPPLTRSSSRVRICDFWTDRRGEEDGTKKVHGRADHHEAS